MLQELRVCVIAANELVAEIGARFEQGDPADEQTERLASLIATIGRLVATTAALPDDLNTEIAGLLARVQATTMVGDRWLEATAGPELATLHMQARVQKVYGLPARDIPPP